MMKPPIRWNARHRSESGQMLLLVALFTVVLIAFVGLAIDIGFAYVTKAQLSKAVDAAALSGMNNINLGTVTAGNVASATFAANYGTNSTGRDLSVVVPSIIFGADVNGNTTLDVSARTSIRTYFVRVLGAIPGLPKWTSFTVGSTAEVTRATLIMTMALDKSGSLNDTDSSGLSGRQEMLGAVTNFLSVFDDVRDKAGLVTFSTVDSLDVKITNHFTAPITAKVKTIYVDSGILVGATFGTGGLSNAFIQETNQVVAAGVDITKAVVFFTDGLANVVREGLFCNGTTKPATDFSFGGYDSNHQVDFFNPTNGDTRCRNPQDNQTPSCCNVGTFTALSGASLKFTQVNVSNDAQDRAVRVAKQMRDNGIVVYSIGLGDNIDTDFLKQVANDPTVPGYKATSYDGEFVFAQDASQLQAAFQRVAEQILLRLTH